MNFLRIIAGLSSKIKIKIFGYSESVSFSDFEGKIPDGNTILCYTMNGEIKNSVFISSLVYHFCLIAHVFFLPLRIRSLPFR